LLMDGIELDESKLTGLQRHNVSCIAILKEDSRSEEELIIERRNTTEHINALFSNIEQTASMAALHRLILEYRLESLS